MAALRHWFNASARRRVDHPLLGAILAEEEDEVEEDEGGGDDDGDDDDDDDDGGDDDDVAGARRGEHMARGWALAPLTARSSTAGDGAGTFHEAKGRRHGSDKAVEPRPRRMAVLEVVSGAADILAWHALLFDAVGDKPLTRAEAMDITNAEAIGW
jgi:hypothetical protein